MKVYADNAATTRISDTAFDAMAPYFKELYGNPSSLYTLGQLSQEALYSARETVAKCLNCDMKEITFTSGGSEADNQAILTGAYLGAAKGKKHIISSAFEHHAVLHTLEKLEKQGFEVTLLPVHSDGFVRVDELENAIREDTALVTIMFANNEIGTVQPICEIGEVCHKKGVLFHTDAVQAAGHIPLDVNALFAVYDEANRNAVRKAHSNAQRAENTKAVNDTTNKETPSETATEGRKSRRRKVADEDAPPFDTDDTEAAETPSTEQSKVDNRPDPAEKPVRTRKRRASTTTENN